MKFYVRFMLGTQCDKSNRQIKLHIRINLFLIRKWNGVRTTRRQKLVFESRKSFRFGGNTTTNGNFITLQKSMFRN